MSEDRLVEIETRLAHQDQALSDLNDVMTQQQASIMRLEQICKVLADRLAALNEAAGDAEIPDQRPPHY